MRLKVAAGVAVASLAVLAPQAATESAPPPTATAIRISGHPGFVRVVVDFTGGRVFAGEVVATDPDPFRDGVVRLPLSRHGVRTVAAPAQVHGVSASVTQGSGRIVIRLQGAPRRFKYVGYRKVRGRQRLAFDLIEAEPPRPAAEVVRGRDGCLSLRSFAVGRRSVRAAGRERDLFEHSLLVRLRRAGGRVYSQRPATAASHRWSTRFRYPRTRRQTGTLEAVALSAKDGTLDCLTQVRVRFGG
jgi:hypothetical protein